MTSGTIWTARKAGLRGRLLRGASLAALIAAGATSAAQAQSLSALRAAVGASNVQIAAMMKAQGPNQGVNTAGMSAAAARALQYQNQVAQAVSLAQQAQAAARQAVLGSQNSSVPDGLVIGGLQPVPNPLPAVQDSTGLSTWQGADQPTQTTSGGKVNVTVAQTQPRAVLSWETFNVGQNTTLNFDQSLNGTSQPSWIALNRVVGTSTSPAQILGTIKAPGTVLIIDQNGILFGGASQVNVNGLIATSLDVGDAIDQSTETPYSAAYRNANFLQYGLLGLADQAIPGTPQYTLSETATCVAGSCTLNASSPVQIAAGANIATNANGFLLFAAPQVINQGALTSPEGQVSLEASTFVTAQRSSGATGSATPNIRGFSLSGDSYVPGEYVENAPGGIISAPQGYVSLQTNNLGGVINDGVLEATTSTSRNGYIQLSAENIQLGTGSTIAIGPDPSAQTIPQDPVSFADFKPSQIDIGGDQSLVEIQQNAMIYAPGGNVNVGVPSGAGTVVDQSSSVGLSRVFIDTGAVIDVAGIPNVMVPASFNSIAIKPVTENDLQNDSSIYKNGFLNGATVYVDPRISGVSSDGVAWVGSPLVPAEAYYRQVGVTVEQLMTKGGNVTLGAASYNPTLSGESVDLAGDVTVKSGAAIDLDGGWVTYQAGWVQTTNLIDAAGNVVNIAEANPNDTFVGIYNGFVAAQPRWGMMQSFADPVLDGRHYEGQYSEGRDAGSLTLKGSTIVLDGTVYANAFPGPVQLADAQAPTAASTVYGDSRNLQAAPSQLPSGGFLFVQGLANNSSGGLSFAGAGDIDIVSQSDYQPLPSSLAYGQSISIDSSGNLIVPTRDPASYLPLDRVDTISLSADALSSMGLSDLSLATSGQITVEPGANLSLAPGGRFDAEAGRTITVDGNVSVPSGTINLQTVFVDPNYGSVFVPEPEQLGSFDVVVNGTLSTRGLWTNDYHAAAGELQGSSYINGGTIDINAAPGVLEYASSTTLADAETCSTSTATPCVNVDLSGSILINSGALLDVSSGGYVSTTGQLNMSAKGGNVSLIEDTAYFQLAINGTAEGAIPGFRVTTDYNGLDYIVPINPSTINARVAIAPGTIRAAGFAGGGTFTLVTPAISFGDGIASTGTELPFDFFSQSGFANYNITSYKTDLIPNTFDNGLGGYNAILATQVLTVGAGQTLDLSQSYFALALGNPALEAAQMVALRRLASGGDIYSVLQPSIPTDAWDRKAVNLTLGGLIELQVAQGGSLIDDAGGVLTVSQLDNEGTIRIPGGTIDQVETLPGIFVQPLNFDTSGGINPTPYSPWGIGVQSLSEVFSINPDGSIDESATTSLVDPSTGNPWYTGSCAMATGCTNAEMATYYDIYLLGTLPLGEGVHLGAGSVTDLSGASIRNPYAAAPNQTDFITGKLFAGGTLEEPAQQQTTTALFQQTLYGIYAATDPQGYRLPEQLTADPGSTLNLSGASDVYDVPGAGGLYTPTPEWSNGGTLDLENGGSIGGATILAQGGASSALGGTLVALNPVFYHDTPPPPPQFGTLVTPISQADISAAGFATLVARGSITSSGDATISLPRGFFLTSLPYDGMHSPDQNNDYYVPVVASGGALTIDAPYIGLESIAQMVENPNVGTAADNSVTFAGSNIDVFGAVLFDNSVANATLEAGGDVRLIGVQLPDLALGLAPPTTANTQTLQGQLTVNDNLTIDAAQVYPATGSTFYVTSTGADYPAYTGLDGTITFGRTTSTTPSAPYTAGADLIIQAANIVQGGVIRVPLGSLTIGSGTQLTLPGGTAVYAPATVSVKATSGSITSVSANGLSIPYGTTTDQTEWYFAPTNSSQLTAQNPPPSGILQFGGSSVAIDSGATIDLTGGGDITAYEFIPGIGGSRDVLNRYNSDEFSADGGYQYPGGTQVYAIVPGLSSNAVAPYDPIYSANYSDLYSSANAGESVYLTGASGIAAGWYTLLPAQYAMLPGGMRIVQDLCYSSGCTIGTNAPPGLSLRLSDGTQIVSGYFGVAGTDTRSSSVSAFEVQSQKVFEQYSQIAITSGDSYFPALAAHADETSPRLPIDAGRLILAPTQALSIGGDFLTAPASGGRGSEVDITGAAFDIVSTDTGQSGNGAIVLTAGGLTDLNAASLLIGGVRTDNADGTTSLDITSTSITVENDSAHPLSAPEVLLAVDDGSSGASGSITLADGATITATGQVSGSLTGNYVIDGSTPGMTGQGAFLRVANAPQRFVTRENVNTSAPGGILTAGAVDLSASTDASNSGSIYVDSSADMSVAANATFSAGDLAFGASQVTFTSNGQGLSGLVVTPQLQALLSQASELTIITPETGTVAFSSGAYDFANVTFDTPSISLLDGSAVALNAQTLAFADTSSVIDSSFVPETCGQLGTCGTGTLDVNAQEIDFNPGTTDLYGFGGAVTLAASNGMFVQGNVLLGAGASAMDFGTAALNMETPFIGDRAVTLKPDQNAPLPSLSLTTTGAVTISNPTGATAPDPAGTPGSSLSIAGDSVSITDTVLRATAGTLTVNSSTGIDLSGSATLETPSYAKTFGNSADPQSVSAPGGTLKLIAQGGDIDTASGTTLSIGGTSGTAGTLALAAPNGNVNLSGTIDASAPSGGGSVSIDTGAAFDLSAFASSWPKDFTGSIAVHSGTGDLMLATGDTLQAQDVSLTADGGLVDIAGTINVSGTNGGEVDLYGIDGVTLESTALIDAHANGYGRLDPRQATGGTVNIGTDQNGAIAVDSGAVIDVAATQTMARLVPMVMNGTTYYTYVPGDTGGTVNFRLPVQIQGDTETVNMTYAGNIEGASAINLEGFQRWNLADIAANTNYVGVTINAQGQAVLDLTAQPGAGQVNFLSCTASATSCTAPAGTPVNFIQTFDISADYAKLGNLTSLPGFQARPGVELDYSGDIVLASNWNLGAGVVDIPAAVAAGLMMPVVPGCTSGCQYYVVPGAEGEIFANYTWLDYRVGASVLGAAPVLTIRAGGNLDINGSITDGFFQLGDQNDPNYLNVALGGGNRYYMPYLAAVCSQGNCSGLTNWQPGSLPDNYIDLSLGSALSNFLYNPLPYSDAANSPAALGTSAGDALSSMQVFPLVATASGMVAAASTSYQLVAGADLSAASGAPSVNPLATVLGQSGSVVVQGRSTYTFSATPGTSQFADQLDFQVGDQYLTAGSWYLAFLSANPQADANSFTFIDLSQAKPSVQNLIAQDAQSFLAEYAGQYTPVYNGTTLTGIETSLDIANLFMLDVMEANIGQIVAKYTPPPPSKYQLTTPPTTYTTLVRSGTGSIDMAAAQDINLQNTATSVGLDGSSSCPCYQLGGSPVYTAGHLVDFAMQNVVDELTGQSFTIDPSQYLEAEDNLNSYDLPAYTYGAVLFTKSLEQFGDGYAGIEIANPVYLTGGGSISLTAGHDVLSRRDGWTAAQLTTGYGGGYFGVAGFFPWIGSPDQAWRVGSVGDVTNILINPQLFTEGVGALGGGNIAISAGNDIVDLTVASDTSVTTANVTSPSLLLPTLGLMQFGGGNVAISAGSDILGGRFDIAEGSAAISAGGDIESYGTFEVPSGFSDAAIADTPRLRLSDATVSIVADGTVELQGISALGVYIQASDTSKGVAPEQNNLDAHGFYSATAGLSILSDGSVTVDNQAPQGFDLSIVTPADEATNGVSSEVYPGSLTAVSLTGTLDLAASYTNVTNQAYQIVLFPSSTGQIGLFAGADIMPVTIDMEDGDPGLLPGVFSIFSPASVGFAGTGRPFGFPAVFPNTLQSVLQTYHDSTPTHLNDPYPVRIDAGGDILDMIVALPKQARIWAGQDIVNMMFFGQNLSPSDITRIVAGRDIVGTTIVAQPYAYVNGQVQAGVPEPALQGNSFVIGGPGYFFLEAGRDAGPFLNSADTNGLLGDYAPSGPLSWGGGILSVGNDWNPYLPATGADVYVEFGVGPGANYDGFRDYYLDPANVAKLPDYLFEQTNQVADRSHPIYEPILIQWMQANAASALETAYGTTNVTYQQAYDIFVTLPELQQQIFLLDDVYFNELTQTSIPASASYKVYSRGYTAVNLLFPASLGYTKNNLGGGGNGANQLVQTGNLDLRLSTIETTRGGNIYILGPGGRVLGGSTVATADQAARHSYIGGQLYAGLSIANKIFGCIGNQPMVPCASSITAIPAGYEGILTLRDGSIDTFTDTDFLLNQSRLFTEAGGNIAMWSSNGNLNAGQGPKTSSNFPPVVFETDPDLYSQVNSVGGVTGAGIAALEPAPGVPAPDVFLIAPRGTVDAGAAGVRVAGNLFVAALTVANANNFSVSGTAVGIPGTAQVNVAAQTSASSSAAASAQAAQAAQTASGGTNEQESIITVDVLGYAGGGGEEEEKRKRKK